MLVLSAMELSTSEEAFLLTRGCTIIPKGPNARAALLSALKGLRLSLRILLVEDNPENRDMLSRRLIRRGYQLSFAMDGAEAVRLAQQERPELVLMDLSLPVMDGWEATRRLKREVPPGRSRSSR